MKQFAIHISILTSLLFFQCNFLTAQESSGIYVRPETVVQFNVQVKDKNTVQDIRNATVAIQPSDGAAREIYCDENGQGTAFLWADRYELLVYKSGYKTLRDTLLIKSVPDTIDTQFLLERK